MIRFWFFYLNFVEVKVVVNLCFDFIVFVGVSEMLKIWIWFGVCLLFINFLFYLLG